MQMENALAEMSLGTHYPIAVSCKLKATQDQARQACLQHSGDLDSEQRKTCRARQEIPQRAVLQFAGWAASKNLMKKP